MSRIITIVIFLLATEVYGQTDAEKFYDLLKPQSENSVTNGVRTVIKPAFVVYKKCLSPQDNQRCGFYPTCSEYCLETIAKNGFFYGYADTFDRLARCNGVNPNQYSIDQKTGRMLDKPEKRNRRCK